MDNNQYAIKTDPDQQDASGGRDRNDNVMPTGETPGEALPDHSAQSRDGGDYGDVQVSAEDLARGYYRAEDDPADPVLNIPMTEPGGFLKRPHGWER